jgi:hypothetical protein
MSNGQDWRSYIHRDEEIDKFEAYLKNPVPVSAYLELVGLQISRRTLLDDINWERPPTAEWYALHMCVQDKRKWPPELLAWGLNRKLLDMYKLQYDIISRILEVRHEAIRKRKDADMAMLPLDDIDGIFRRAYENMAPRFASTTVPASWYLKAEYTFTSICKRSAIRMLHHAFYDQDSKQWTQAGRDNWDGFFRNSRSPQSLSRPSFELGKAGSKSMPPKNAISNPLQDLPNEIISRILDYALDPPTLCRSSNIDHTSRWFREFALDWSSRQTITIRASQWPQDPPRRFPSGWLPVNLLQKARKVRFDFDGCHASRRSVHPVLEQLADIWKTKNELNSLVLPVAPQMRYLERVRPRVELDSVQRSTFAPLEGLPGIDPEYVADFGAPTGNWEHHFLCEVASDLYEDHGEILPFVLRQAPRLLNVRSGIFGTSVLYQAAQNSRTRNMELLLNTPGIDVNLPNANGDTPFRGAAIISNNETAMMLARHEGFRATKADFHFAVFYMLSYEVIAALCNAYGGAPSCVADEGIVSRVMRDHNHHVLL